MSIGPASDLAAVILAAGRSTRMGRPKMLLPWGNTSVIGHLIAQWKALGSPQIGVVMAADDSALTAELDRLRVPEATRIVNPQPDRGMFSSIQSASLWGGWQKGPSRWAIVLGDQPHLEPRTLRGLLEFAAQDRLAVCQPAYAGKATHPVLLPKAVFLKLARSVAPNLRVFLSEIPRRLCHLDDPGLGEDLDFPQDYARIIARLSGLTKRLP